MPIAEATAAALPLPRAVATRSDRDFYSLAAVVILIVTLVGFHPFYIAGEGMRGRKVSPHLFPLVLVHGVLMTAWVLLFLAQALLIASRNRRLHMKLGWGGVAIAVGVAITGFMVAVQSVRPFPQIPFWGMAYRQFLLVMLAEVALFTAFVGAGFLFRMQPERHRPMMLLASLSILAGATVRMPLLFPLFGESGWIGIFGPIFTLGAAFLLTRTVLRGVLDRWLATVYAVLVLFYVSACWLAVSDAWSVLAKAIFEV